MSEECPDTDPAWWKDDENPIEQVGFCVIFLCSVLLIVKNCNNFSKIRKAINHGRLRLLYTINVLILLMLVINLINYGDGLYALIFGKGYMDLYGSYLFSIEGALLLEVIVALGWFFWAPLLLVILGLSKRAAKFYSRVLLFIICSAILYDMWVEYRFLSTVNFCEYFDDPDAFAAQEQTYVSTAILLINHTLFFIFCFGVVMKTKNFFIENGASSLNRIRNLALATMIAGFVQIFLGCDLGPSYFAHDLEAAGNSIGATVKDQLLWTLLFLFFTLCDNLIPITFLIVNSNPELQVEKTVPVSTDITEDEEAHRESDYRYYHELRANLDNIPRISIY